MEEKLLNKDIIMLDSVVKHIKEKDNKLSTFDINVFNSFEFILFVNLDIIRYELSNGSILSDETADAMLWLFVFHVFEYYHHDFPEIYEECSQLYFSLKKYNDKLSASIVPAKVDGSKKKWVGFFNKAITKILIPQ